MERKTGHIRHASKLQTKVKCILLYCCFLNWHGREHVSELGVEVFLADLAKVVDDVELRGDVDGQVALHALDHVVLAVLVLFPDGTRIAA